MKVMIYIGVIIILIGGVWMCFDLGQVFKKTAYTGNEIAKHVIMISLDGVYEADFDNLMQRPVFLELINRGAYSNQVTTVYPTLTYPIHTSIVTGTTPDKHGIYHNHQLQVGVPIKNQTWYWYQDEVKVPSLFDKLAQHQFVTASILWPVTGRGNITYNIPEIIALAGENQATKLLESGTPMYLVKSYLKYGKILGDGTQPKLDQFSTAVAVDTIKSKKPNLLAIHLISVDHFRHDFGVESIESVKAFNVYEQSVMEIVEAVKEAGYYDDTVFVVTSDHGQMDVHQNVYLNNVLKRAGYITETEDGLNYKAYVQSLGLGAYVYIKDHDSVIKKEVMTLLRSVMQDPTYGIETIYTVNDLKRLHASSDVDIAIEAKAGYQFKDDLTSKDVKSNFTKGNHGYSPLKAGYKTIVMISGVGIKNQFEMGNISVMDIAPTIASILGLDFYDCDGRVLNEIFEEGEKENE